MSKSVKDVWTVVVGNPKLDKPDLSNVGKICVDTNGKRLGFQTRKEARVVAKERMKWNPYWYYRAERILPR